MSAPTLTREYDPWGNLIQGSATSGYAFTGREWDSESGLYYYRARYYDPSVGRFISRDPAGLAAGPNLQAYVSNNSVNFIDPQGLWLEGAHNRILDASFAGLEPEGLPRFKRASYDIDKHQDPADAYMHAMAAPGMGPATAQFLFEKFVKGKMKQAVCAERGATRAPHSTLWARGCMP